MVVTVSACVATHSYGGMGWGRDGGGGTYACGTKTWGWSNVGNVGALPE